MAEHSITITESPTIRETREGSTINHTVAINGECLGWVVEHRNANGKTIGWGVWGDQGPDGLFPGRDEAANWLIDPEIEFYTCDAKRVK